MAKTRTYGHDGTIHSNESLDVEVDSKGNVTSVWFRCTLLPFRQFDVDEERAKDMRSAYKKGSSIPGLVAVELVDN